MYDNRFTNHTTSSSDAAMVLVSVDADSSQCLSAQVIDSVADQSVKGIISTYLLAVLCSGSTIIWEEERIGLGFQILIHGCSLYVGYLIAYLLNNWLPRDVTAVLIFTGIFFLTYLIIWLIIYLIERKRANKFNSHLK